MKYFLANYGKAEGPYSLEELRMLCITPETLVWTERLIKGSNASNIPDLKNIFQPNKPPIGGQNSQFYINPNKRNHLPVMLINGLIFLF